MPANEVVQMLNQALRAMAIGIPGVFSVLAVFYGVIKLISSRAKGESED